MRQLQLDEEALRADRAIAKVTASSARLAKTLNNGVVPFAEYERAIAELLLRHGSDNCTVCARARKLLGRE